MIDYRGKHVFITGGSEGLGRSLALKLVKAGADVTIVARRAEVLAQVVSEVRELDSSCIGRICFQAADVTNPSTLEQAVQEAEANFGPISILFPCAGKAFMGYAHDHTIDTQRIAFDLNFFGVYNAVTSVLPSMHRQKQGVICFVTTANAMTSYIGYSAYSPSKYAVRGFSDCLRNELSASGISIHIAFPGGIDSPGYANEMLSKPDECKAIEASDTLYSADAIANSILKDLQNGVYNIYCGDLGIVFLGILGAGLSPRKNPALDILLLPLAIFVGWLTRAFWDMQVKAGAKKRGE